MRFLPAVVWISTPGKIRCLEPDPAGGNRIPRRSTGCSRVESGSIDRSLELPVFLCDPLAGGVDEFFAGATVDSLEHVVELFAAFEHAADERGEPLAHFGRHHGLDERERDRTKAVRRDLVGPAQGFGRPSWPALLEVCEGGLPKLAIVERCAARPLKPGTSRCRRRAIAVDSRRSATTDDPERLRDQALEGAVGRGSG